MLSRKECESLLKQYRAKRYIAKLNPVLEFAVKNDDMELLKKYTKLYAKHNHYSYEEFENSLYDFESEYYDEDNIVEEEELSAVRKESEITYLNNVAKELSADTSTEVLTYCIAFAGEFASIYRENITKFLDKLTFIRFSEETMYDKNFQYHIIHLFSPLNDQGNDVYREPFYLKQFLENNIENISVKFASDLLSRHSFRLHQDLQNLEKNFDLIRCYQILLNSIVEKSTVNLIESD